MSEDIESPDSGGEGIAATDPAAVSLALAGASRERADAFLQDQQKLIADQRHHLHAQFKHLGLRIWGERMSVLLRIATAFTGLAFAAGVAFLIWNAANSNQLIVDSFSVPPDMAARGLSGQVVAAQIVDRLVDMQAKTTSQRALQSYANSFSDGVKVEIPETGISLSELDRFLREKLGHDIHVSGEVVRIKDGIRLTARAQAGASVEGPEQNFDALAAKLSEHIYALTQPYRYAIYLAGQNRGDESTAALRALSASGPAAERAWAYNGLGVRTFETNGPREALAVLRNAGPLNAHIYLPVANAANQEAWIGLTEASLQQNREALDLLNNYSKGVIRADTIPLNGAGLRANIASQQGDFAAAVNNETLVVQSGIVAGGGSSSAVLGTYQALQHDISGARESQANPAPVSNATPGFNEFERLWAAVLIEDTAENWSGVLSLRKDAAPIIAKYPGIGEVLPTTVDLLVALAQAKLGHFSEAYAQVANTPDDCYPCLITRAQIAGLQGQRGRADYWFVRAVKAAPSIPFAHAAWGKALKERGDLNAAIAQFKLANQKGPHFADPLEMWGEVLIAQNRSDLAIVKFTEANKYAPNWGRLHLKWGEALSYLGKPAEAQKQFTRAGELDLAAAEKSELAKVRK